MNFETPQSIKDRIKKQFKTDTRLFVLMNPKCKFCKKRSGSSVICLYCGKERKI
jgi:hypothetical protein